jgi:hypothetical protein
MIDALLFAVKEAVSRQYSYDERTCDVRADGSPPPSCGDYFLAVHQAGGRSEMDNALDQYLGFDLTLTYRVTVPLDRLADQELANKLARKQGPRGQPSLNARLDQVQTFMHMNWGVIQDANNYLVQWAKEEVVVCGFAEPARYTTTETPRFESGAWLSADADADHVALVGVAHFDRARRLQVLQYFV